DVTPAKVAGDSVKEGDVLEFCGLGGEYERDFSLDQLAEHIAGFSAAAIRGVTKTASPTSDQPISVG
ncbi:MAG: hypothetical protein ACKOAH_05480, partial [Pirellula sp.]